MSLRALWRSLWTEELPPAMLTDNIPCPRCSGRMPSFRSTELTSYRSVNGRIVESVTGWLVHCQSCGMLYGIWDHGTFVPHATARPEGRPELPPQLRAALARTDAAADDEAALAPVPRQPPKW